MDLVGEPWAWGFLSHPGCHVWVDCAICLQACPYAEGNAKLAPEKRKAQAEDLVARHNAFLERDAGSSSTFRPKKMPRGSVVKMLGIVDNQASNVRRAFASLTFACGFLQVDFLAWYILLQVELLQVDFLVWYIIYRVFYYKWTSTSDFSSTANEVDFSA